MPTYRIYYTGSDGHIVAPPEIIEGSDDKDAIEKARQFADGRTIELWDRDRLLIKIEVKKQLSAE
jgi:hypothetical protein